MADPLRASHDPDPRPGLDRDVRSVTGERYPYAWLWLLVGGLVLSAAYSFLPDAAQNVAYVGAGLAGVTAIVAGVQLHRPPHPVPWYLMALGQLVWTAADATGVVLTARGEDGFPSWADAGYLVAYPILALGLMLLLRARGGWRDRASILDGLIVTAALGLLSWVLLARPVAAYAESWPAAVVGAAYPILDIVMLGMLVALLVTPGGRTPSLRLLLAAITLLVVGDTASTALGLGGLESTEPLDPLWLVSYLMWGAAALHPSMYASTQPGAPLPPRLSRARLAALALAVVTPPAVLAVQQAMGLRLDVWAVVVASVVIFGLAIARTGVVVQQLTAISRAREVLQVELAHQASHDALTGLPNRPEAMRLITGALSRAQRSGAVIGLLFLDLDGFKRVNDTLGHGAGDQVLKIIAGRLRQQVRGGDVVARLGGDEFVALLEPLDEQSSAVGVANRLISAASAPIQIGGRTVQLGASVGIALSQDGSVDADALLQEADTAVYRAKAGGRGRSEVFDVALRDQLRARAELETALTAAVKNDQLVLHFQPVVELTSGAVQGYEALVRWQRPGAGLLFPADFLASAADSDLIDEIDLWVLRHAIRQVQRWDSASTGRLFVAVNVAARHVASPRFRVDVVEILAVSGLRPSRLVLEMRESAFLNDPVAITNLVDLRRTGVRISIDDFAAGHESIARLEAMPVDSIKVGDGYLTNDSVPARRLLRLVVQAAHAFELPVVAEGVETAEQLEVLRDLGCEFGQGHLIGSPRPADQIPDPTAASPLGRAVGVD